MSRAKETWIIIKVLKAMVIKFTKSTLLRKAGTFSLPVVPETTVHIPKSSTMASFLTPSNRRRRPRCRQTSPPLRLHPQDLLPEADQPTHLHQSSETTPPPTHPVPLLPRRLHLRAEVHRLGYRCSLRIQFQTPSTRTLRQSSLEHHLLESPSIGGRHSLLLGRRVRASE